MGDNNGFTVQATATSFGILEVLHNRTVGGVTEIAEELDVSKSAVHNHLSTLCSLGYVQNVNGQYELTHQFLKLGLKTRNRNPVYERAEEELRTLSEHTNAVVNLVVPEQRFGVYLFRVGGNSHPIEEGDYVDLHTIAAGKAILAFWTPDKIEDYVKQHGLSQHTERTVTDPAALRSQIRSIRDRRIAFDRGELSEEWQCVASPIVINGDPVGAISVSGRADRMQGKRLEEDAAGLVTSAAKSIQLRILSKQNPDT
jgi:DNA-binding IclR family transcriptional regulator